MHDDRDILIRRHFEVMRDLIWIEDLEPRCRAEGMEAERIQHLRAAWNAYSEARDWEWWREHAAKDFSERLQADIKEAAARIDAMTPYRQALTEALRRPADDKDKGIDR